MEKPAVSLECDVLVIGAGVSGYCAAIQAGRLGARTVLVEKDEVLGGNAGPNLGVGITGADRYSRYATETGVIHELHEEGGWINAFTRTSPGSMGYSISRRFEALVQQYLRQAGVTVLKRHVAREPVLAGDGGIAAVICEDIAAFRTVRIAVGHVVIEASGDGEIGALAGADFDMGSEARDEYGERSAPAVRTHHVQGTSLVAIAHRVDHAVDFVAPPGLPPFQPRVWHSRIGSFLSHHNGWFSPRRDLFFLYVTETGGNRDTIRDDGQIYEDLLDQLWSEWDHIKNGPHREEAACWDLLWVSPKAGKRESRRFLGDVVLTQSHLEEGRFFPDDIAWGGHDLDDHQPLGEGSDIFAHSIPPLYGIPLRACFSRNVPNLLFGGRLISATHLAHSSSRVMKTGGAVGQGVGYAAALCCRHGCTPRQLYETHLDELRLGLFAADASIAGPHPCLPGDAAPAATVSAGSETRFNDQEPGPAVPLIAPAGLLLWDWPEQIEQLDLHLRNTTAQPIDINLRIKRPVSDRKWWSMDEYHRLKRNDLRDSSWRDIATFSVTLPPNHRGWFTARPEQPVHLDPKDPTRDDDRLLIAVDEDRRVEWTLQNSAGRGCGRIATLVEHSHHSDEWTTLDAVPTLRLTPSPMLGEAANVINGCKQRFSRAPLNMWLSHPGREMPQDMTLAWNAPREIATVVVIFDNLTADRSNYPWEEGPRVLPHLVKDYCVSVRNDAGEWQTLVAVTGNVHRCRTHTFDRPVTADALRVTVTAMHGASEQARIYEIRALSTIGTRTGTAE
jgi:hypothetical protein